MTYEDNEIVRMGKGVSEQVSKRSKEISENITESAEKLLSEDNIVGINLTSELIEGYISDSVKEINNLEKIGDKIKSRLNDEGYIYKGWNLDDDRELIEVKYESSTDVIIGKANCYPGDVFVGSIGHTLASHRVAKKVLGEDYSLDMS